jgi:hypothetical protein
MTLQARAIAQQAKTLADLERRMIELLALRRAICIANASRNWPGGARRRSLRMKPVWRVGSGESRRGGLQG